MVTLCAHVHHRRFIDSSKGPRGSGSAPRLLMHDRFSAAAVTPGQGLQPRGEFEDFKKYIYMYMSTLRERCYI